MGSVAGWISVEERLPNTEDDVLLFTTLGIRLGWCPNKPVRRKSGLNQNPAWRPLGDFDNCEVTHWMPLPDPPAPKQLEFRDIVEDIIIP